MESNRNYIVSFGDSNKYRVSFPGSKEEFEKSDLLKGLKDKVCDYLKGKFPTGGFADTVRIDVEDSDGRGNYPELDKTNLEDLLKSLARQVEVMREGKELNNNAPFDKI